MTLGTKGLRVKISCIGPTWLLCILGKQKQAKNESRKPKQNTHRRETSLALCLDTCPPARQEEGRKLSAPKPCVTTPFQTNTIELPWLLPWSWIRRIYICCCSRCVFYVVSIAALHCFPHANAHYHVMYSISAITEKWTYSYLIGNFGAFWRRY